MTERVQEVGVNGIPTLIVDGKYSVNGAAPAEEFLQILKKVYKDGITGTLLFPTMIKE
jgi:predicted DsbA family dithiol-disulfide isomerase